MLRRGAARLALFEQVPSPLDLQVDLDPLVPHEEPGGNLVDIYGSRTRYIGPVTALAGARINCAPRSRPFLPNPCRASCPMMDLVPALVTLVPHFPATW